MRQLFRVPLIWACGLLGLAVLLSVNVFCRAWVRVRSGDELIRVVGSARKPIRSDFIIWSSSISHDAPTIPVAYKLLMADYKDIRKYLVDKGVPEKEILSMGVEVETLYTRVKINPNLPPEKDSDRNYYQKVNGYQLTQSIEVRSHKVDLVGQLSRESTELISRGLRFNSSNPMYLYTKLSDLKVTMQAEAAADARARAEKIAESSGASLGKLRYSRMSTPAITPLYASQEDDGGVDDTSSLEKKITAIVSAGYAIQ
jgi:hypothetical protein